MERERRGREREEMERERRPGAHNSVFGFGGGRLRSHVRALPAEKRPILPKHALHVHTGGFKPEKMGVFTLASQVCLNRTGVPRS